MKKTFNAQEYEIFTDFLQMTQKGLKASMAGLLKKLYPKVIQTKDYLIAPGSIPVGLVAHLDTVFAEPPNSIYCDWNKGVMWSPQGLGADDRAGVFAIVKLLLDDYRPTVIFTTDEEVGGKGAMRLVKDKPKNFLKLKYLIQLDRCGANDCVFYYDNNEDFVDYVETFGFTEAFGTYSDICEICPSWGISGVNLSVGYQDEHSYVERLSIPQLFNTISRVKKMLDAAEEAPTFEYTAAPYVDSYYKYYPYQLRQQVCDCCGNSFYEFDLIPVYMSNHRVRHYCGNCLPDDIGWCAECGEAMEGEGVCWKCERLMSEN